MSGYEEAHTAVVSIHFINIAGTSRDDWTGSTAQAIWLIDNPADAHRLKEQLTGLLGEPDTEMLLDAPAMKGLAELGADCVRPGRRR